MVGLGGRKPTAHKKIKAKIAAGKNKTPTTTQAANKPNLTAEQLAAINDRLKGTDHTYMDWRNTMSNAEFAQYQRSQKAASEQKLAAGGFGDTSGQGNRQVAAGSGGIVDTGKGTFLTGDRRLGQEMLASEQARGTQTTQELTASQRAIMEQQAKEQAEQQAAADLLSDQAVTAEAVAGATKIIAQEERGPVDIGAGLVVKDARLKTFMAGILQSKPPYIPTIPFIKKLDIAMPEDNPFLDDPAVYESELKTQIEKLQYEETFNGLQSIGFAKEYFANIADLNVGSLAAGKGLGGFIYKSIPDSGVAGGMKEAKTKISESKTTITWINSQMKSGRMDPDTGRQLFEEALRQAYEGQAAYKYYSNFSYKFAADADNTDPVESDLVQLEVQIRQAADEWGFQI